MKPQLISCLRDIKTESCGPLTVFKSERDLVGSLQQFAKEAPDALPSKHPNDFVILVLGEWDESSGKITSYTEPRTLGTVFDILPKTI